MATHGCTSACLSLPAMVADGTVKAMHLTVHDGMLSSPEEHRLLYKGAVTYEYITVI